MQYLITMWYHESILFYTSAINLQLSEVRILLQTLNTQQYLITMWYHESILFIPVLSTYSSLR